MEQIVELVFFSESVEVEPAAPGSGDAFGGQPIERDCRTVHNNIVTAHRRNGLLFVAQIRFYKINPRVSKLPDQGLALVFGNIPDGDALEIRIFHQIPDSFAADFSCASKTEYIHRQSPCLNRTASYFIEFLPCHAKSHNKKSEPEDQVQNAVP